MTDQELYNSAEGAALRAALDAFRRAKSKDTGQALFLFIIKLLGRTDWYDPKAPKRLPVSPDYPFGPGDELVKIPDSQPTLWLGGINALIRLQRSELQNNDQELKKLILDHLGVRRDERKRLVKLLSRGRKGKPPASANWRTEMRTAYVWMAKHNGITREELARGMAGYPRHPPRQRGNVRQSDRLPGQSISLAAASRLLSRDRTP